MQGCSTTSFSDVCNSRVKIEDWARERREAGPGRSRGQSDLYLPSLQEMIREQTLWLLNCS